MTKKEVMCQAHFTGTDNLKHRCTQKPDHEGRHYCFLCRIWSEVVKNG